MMQLRRLVNAPRDIKAWFEWRRVRPRLLVGIDSPLEKQQVQPNVVRYKAPVTLQVYLPRDHEVVVEFGTLRGWLNSSAGGRSCVLSASGNPRFGIASTKGWHTFLVELSGDMEIYPDWGYSFEIPLDLPHRVRFSSMRCGSKSLTLRYEHGGYRSPEGKYQQVRPRTVDCPLADA